ncbi:MAG: 50S ribosomal protein L29 [Clostridiales bacterium]|jgi:large subunit ribosomal protein L29|nr:50S ribosomal protein L29 [Clostridiales bacterium]
MKTSEFMSMNPQQLSEKIADLKAELFNLRFRLATGQLENTMQISSVKRDIARAMTVQTQALKKAGSKQ